MDIIDFERLRVPRRRTFLQAGKGELSGFSPAAAQGRMWTMYERNKRAGRTLLDNICGGVLSVSA